MPLIHSALRNTGAAAIWALYSNTHEQGLEHVPLHGTPTIVVSNHHNQLVDVCAMTRNFPHHRVTQYWAKASLFRHPVSRFVLLNSGNVPVDRRASDNIKLFGSSLDALAQGEVLTLFPEGTSYTEPRILQVKDGASWLCCLFAKRRVEQPVLKPLVLIPAGLVYTDKTRYRSAVIKRIGAPIDITALEEAFVIAEGEEAQKEVVKRLTALIELKIIELTINAPDWNTAHAALMARQVLWGDDTRIELSQFVDVSQTLTDLFTSTSLPPDVGLEEAKKELVQYLALLEAVGTSHAVLNDTHPRPTTSPRRTFLRLLSFAFSSLIHFPPFALPFALHLPTYIAASQAPKLAGDEVEAIAQNKVVLGLVTQVFTFPLFAYLVSRSAWVPQLRSWRALVFTAALVFLHSRLVDANYARWKRLRTAWTVFRAAWNAKGSRRLADEELRPFLAPWTPPANPYVRQAAGAAATPPVPLPLPRPKNVPTTALVPHLLDARARAVGALGRMLVKLEESGDVHVAASAHLARAYGGTSVDGDVGTVESTKDGVAPVNIANATRRASEVLAFLKLRGAVFPTASRAA